MLVYLDKVEVFNCLLLPFLAFLAATFSMRKARYDEINPPLKYLWLLLLPYRKIEGFWREVCLHLSFAAIALAATAPTNLHNHTWGIVWLLILGNFLFGYLSQLYLNEETAMPMDADKTKKVIRVGILVALGYLSSVVLVIVGVVSTPCKA